MKRSRARCWTVFLLMVSVLTSECMFSMGQELATEPVKKPAAIPPKILELDKMRILNPQETVFVDAGNKRVVLKGNVVLREGLLELFCCRTQSKEHESILAVDARASTIHSALLLIGAKSGSPAHFTTEFFPPTGEIIDVSVVWNDAQNKPQRRPAQQWIRHSIYRYFGAPLQQLPVGVKFTEDSLLRYDDKNRELSWYGPMSEETRNEFKAMSADKPFRQAIDSFFERSQLQIMTTHWVFAGSGFDSDPETGKQIYLADATGEMICVANFPSAMIDVAEISSTSGESLIYEANTPEIPELESTVWIELKPGIKKQDVKKE